MTRGSKKRLSHEDELREALRSKGQFWTPEWVARFMAAYVLQDNPDRLLDPALGEGVFFRVSRDYAARRGFNLALFGCDIDPSVRGLAQRAGVAAADLQNFEVRDFVLNPPSRTFPAILANPPYIRHHRLPPAYKAALREFAREAMGIAPDGRAGLHVYFLIRTLQSLSPGGRLAYIVSADICEGVFADALWRWITSRFRLDAVVAFSTAAAPFPEVDTNALVLCIRNAEPRSEFDWVLCHRRDPLPLELFLSGKVFDKSESFEVRTRHLAEALQTGLSRSPSTADHGRYLLGDFARVMRGIATGDNDFFFLTSARAHELGIPDSLLVNAVGRTRDIQGDRFTANDLADLEKQGRPTRLFSINGYSLDQLPPPVITYLKSGEARGVPLKTLIRTRKPWYRMETRKVPPILFAYLGRRNARFIRNEANAVPLTCLLCVYPRADSPDFVERLWKVLSHPRTIANLRLVGKTYGGDAIKVEPRALERLPLPEDLVLAEGLEKKAAPRQASLNITAA